jgi:hypothetical protein
MIMGNSHTLAVATLITWLLAESLGLVMLRTWFASGAAGRRKATPDGMSMPILLSHAGLAFTGFVCWIAFLLSASAIPAFLAICFLAPAIGLGISTVSVWTPYPVRRPPDPAGPPEADDDRMAGVIPDQSLSRSLDDEALARQVVDELLARNLEHGGRTGMTLNPRTLVPFIHGVLAIFTFFLAMLAAIAAL